MIFLETGKNIKIILLSMVIAALGACKSEPVDIRLNLEEGREYIHNITITNTAKTLFTNYTGTFTVTVSLLIEKISDTAIFAKVQCKKAALVTQINKENFSTVFNTESVDKNDFMSAGYKVFANTPFDVVLPKKGRVHYANESETWNKIDSCLTDFPLHEKEKITESLKGMAKTLKNGLERELVVFPEKPVIKGEKWKNRIESNIYRNVTAVLEYQLMEIEEDYFIINELTTYSVEKTQDTAVSAESEQQRMYDIIDGKSTAEIKIDKNTGWIIERTVREKLVTDDGRGIPITTITSIKITN